MEDDNMAYWYEVYTSYSVNNVLFIQKSEWFFTICTRGSNVTRSYVSHSVYWRLPVTSPLQDWQHGRGNVTDIISKLLTSFPLDFKTLCQKAVIKWTQISWNYIYLVFQILVINQNTGFALFHQIQLHMNPDNSSPR